jgi:glycosyltransferase involved in cell wall biosynthesis
MRCQLLSHAKYILSVQNNITCLNSISMQNSNFDALSSTSVGVPLSNYEFPDGVCFGFLTYDLQTFTEDCLYRVSQVIQPASLKAYPVIFHSAQSASRIPYLMSNERGRYLPVNRQGSTPEGFASNVNFLSAWRCVRDSDVVVLFGLQGGTALLAGLLASIMGKPLVSVNQTLPLEWERQRRWWVRSAKRWLLNRCVIHISQTPATPQVLMQVYGVSPATIVAAPFEAGAARFRELLDAADVTERPSLREGPEQCVILFAGNLHPFKGVLLLLEALSCNPNRKQILCIFAGPEEAGNGEWGTIESYQKYAADIGVSQQVRFTGKVTPDRLASLYRECDLVILPTYKDCFPKVLVEGALAGKPLITTAANGAAGSMVVDGVNGFIIPPGNAKALSECIDKLLDPTLRARMGARSREIVDELCNEGRETFGFKVALEKVLHFRR